MNQNQIVLRNCKCCRFWLNGNCRRYDCRYDHTPPQSSVWYYMEQKINAIEHEVINKMSKMLNVLEDKISGNMVKITDKLYSELKEINSVLNSKIITELKEETHHESMKKRSNDDSVYHANLQKSIKEMMIDINETKSTFKSIQKSFQIFEEALNKNDTKSRNLINIKQINKDISGITKQMTEDKKVFIQYLDDFKSIIEEKSKMTRSERLMEDMMKQISKDLKQNNINLEDSLGETLLNQSVLNQQINKNLIDASTNYQWVCEELSCFREKLNKNKKQIHHLIHIKAEKESNGYKEVKECIEQVERTLTDHFDESLFEIYEKNELNHKKIIDMIDNEYKNMEYNDDNKEQREYMNTELHIMKNKNYNNEDKDIYIGPIVCNELHIGPFLGGEESNNGKRKNLL